MNEETISRRVSFGRYAFDFSTARLWADGSEIKLTRKAAAVLATLLERAGQPVSKQELFACVWRNTVVGDDALATCIQELRKALGDDARQPRYIETRHRLGYRFIAQLSAESTSRHMAIAVLPFVDMSAVRDQDFFCEGLAEELINALTYVEGLRVVSRSASFQFNAAALDVQDVGRRLGATALLEGSVRKAGDVLRITVQLIDVATGYHIWSQRFDRRLGDVFAIQDEIAESVATTMRGTALSGRERSAVRRQQTATDAYEYFLRGRQSLHRMREPDLDRSRQMFELALEIDPKYAPAWAGLATVHCLLYEWWGANDKDLRRAEDASERAMRLAPNLADANVARGFSLSLLRRYEEAERHFESAIAINPNLFDAYYYFGRACFARGDIARSADLFGKAAQVRQEDFQSLVLQAQSLRIVGRADEALTVNRESIARAERVLRLNPADGRALSLCSLALYEDGQTERALEWSRRSLELYPDDMSTLINAACLNTRIGDKEAAMQHLERAFSRGWGKRDWIEHDPDYDPLRDDPRFQRLLEKLK